MWLFLTCLGKRNTIGDGRVLVRPSGTEPLLRIMAEAATPELVHEYVERIGDVARAELEVE